MLTALACNLEYVAELQYRTMCIGTPNILTDEQMAEVMERFSPTASPAAARPDIERGGGPAEIFTSLRMALNTPASNAILQESQPRAQQARGWLFACGGESLLKRQGRRPCEAVSWKIFPVSKCRDNLAAAQSLPAGNCPIRYLLVPMPQDCAYFTKAAAALPWGTGSENEGCYSMNEKAKKYVTMFRQVKIASAATVDAGGHPQSRIINIMIANDDGMYIVTSKGKPFYKQLTATGEIALSACVRIASRLNLPDACASQIKSGWMRYFSRIRA